MAPFSGQKSLLFSTEDLFFRGGKGKNCKPILQTHTWNEIFKRSLSHSMLSQRSLWVYFLIFLLCFHHNLSIKTLAVTLFSPLSLWFLTCFPICLFFLVGSQQYRRLKMVHRDLRVHQGQLCFLTMRDLQWTLGQRVYPRDHRPLCLMHLLHSTILSFHHHTHLHLSSLPKIHHLLLQRHLQILRNYLMYHIVPFTSSPMILRNIQ